MGWGFYLNSHHTIKHNILLKKILINFTLVLNTDFMKLILVLAFTFLSMFCFAQNSDFKYVTKIMTGIPNAQESSTTSIANFIKSNFREPEDRLKAAFYWTATNIDYAVEDIDRAPNYESNEYLINKTMRHKRGVCQAFTEVLNELVRKLDFEAFVISGYVRQNGRVITDYGHAWNSIKLDKEWYLFDPTWAAGYFLVRANDLAHNRSNYIKNFSSEYFKAHPSEFIKTHMPFDPLWQFSDQIINYRDFNHSQFHNKSSANFNYLESISKLGSNDDLYNIKNAIIRIEAMGSGNILTQNYLDILKRNLEIATLNKDGEIYNKALEFHANGIKLFNDYVVLFNQNNLKINTKRTQLNQLLDEAQNTAKKAVVIYESISTSNSTLQLNIRIKMGEMDELLERIEQEKSYLKRI